MPGTAIVGRTVKEVLGKASYDRFRPWIVRALCGESVQFQGSRLEADGKRRTMDVSLIPRLNDQQGVEGIYVLTHDVTDILVAQDRIRQLQEELAHAGRLNTMGEMASGLAHEVNQPLAAIMSYADGALRRLNELPGRHEGLAEAIRRIVEQAQRAADVISRLRAFVARTSVQRARVDILELINEALRLLEVAVNSSETQVQVETVDGLSRPLADRIQIVQVLVSLIVNALEAMSAVPSDQRRLCLRVMPTKDGVQVNVSDAGCGIPSEVADYLFQPFHTTKPHGMGMGLAISRSIIESHGGRIWASAIPGQGATFHFTLPASAE